MAKSDDDTSVQRITPKGKIEQLWRAKRAMNSRVGEERAAYGDMVTKAVDKDHLDKKAFDVVTSLAKLESGKAARHWRMILVYAEAFDFARQADLVDAAEDAEDADEKRGAVDEVTSGFGGPPARVKQTASTLHPEKVLKAFTEKLGKIDVPDDLQVELQRAVSSHPDLAGELEKIAGDRTLALATAPGSKRSRKPRSPAVDAAREFGIGQQ